MSAQAAPGLSTAATIINLHPDLATLLASPPTDALLALAQELVSRPDHSHPVKSAIIAWIQWAQLVLASAGGGNGLLVNNRTFTSAIDVELSRLGEIHSSASPVVPVKIPLENGKWKHAFSFGELMKVVDVGSIKSCVFGDIRRGYVTSKKNEHYYAVTGDPVVVKVCNLDLFARRTNTKGDLVFEDVNQELAVMTLLSRFEHPYILKLSAAGKDDINCLYTVFPMGKQSLWDKLKTEGGCNTLAFFHQVRTQIGSALTCLHSLGFAHRDVSLENILEMEDRTLRLIDFGLCKQLSLLNRDDGLWGRIGLEVQGDQGFLVGKTRYCAPELFIAPPGVKHTELRYDAQKADVFGLGICLYVLVYNAFPYNHVYRDRYLVSTSQLVEFWGNDPGRFLKVDPPIQPWMERILHLDATKRWTARECCM